MTSDSQLQVREAQTDKGLRSGALSMATSLILAVASAAPAYSLTTPRWPSSSDTSASRPRPSWCSPSSRSCSSPSATPALNRRDPDCGTIFTWATRSLNPSLGFLGGWAIIASFVLVIGSLAQVAGQYVFLLAGAENIGSDPANWRVLLAGLGWLALMTLVCYRGIEIAAAVQRALLFLEFGMLVVLSVVALVKVYAGSAPPGTRRPSLSLAQPLRGRVLERVRQRAGADALHLLGLGDGAHRQRGDHRPAPRPWPRRDLVHGSAGVAVLSSPRSPRSPSPASATPGSASTTRTTPGTSSTASAPPCSGRAVSARCCGTC
ncbi:amino acid permease [Streptomyces sp. L7]